MKKIVYTIILLSLLQVQCLGQSSISLAGAARWGSESIPLFIDNFGNKVTLSTGSGISAGGEYSYDFSWLFNLTSDVMIQYSNLSQKGKNANGHFIGMEMHITPSLTFPAREDPKFKVLLGAGAGLYTFNTIKVFAKGAGGENMTFKYKPALGPHIQVLFRIKAVNDSYLTIGVRYYIVSYTFTDKGSTHYSTLKEISNPNGSGIGLFISIGEYL